jgi:GNAT superfamily N-acetyltransferase
VNEIEEDRWLSAIFGYGVFRVNLSRVGGEADVDAGDMVQTHASQQHRAMYYAKVDTARIEEVRQLHAAGFYVVDVNVTFGAETSSVAPSGPRARWDGSIREVGELGPAEQQVVLEIAESCFRYSRFHLDPLIPVATANHIKREWIASYVRKKRGEKLFVAVREGRPVGFLAVLAAKNAGRHIRIIDLIGVRPEAQGRGIGRALVDFFVDRCKSECDVLQVGTQVVNVPSMRLYLQCGLSIMHSAYVMHSHVGTGAAF